MREDLAGTIERIASERSRLFEQLPCYGGGLEWCQAHSDLCDRAIRAIFQAAVADEPDAPALALIATGGYGRREMAPYSDIDITLVPLEDGAVAIDRLVHRLYQDIHAAFGTVFRISVGWAFRLIADAPGLDARTRTGLLDARFVAGSPDALRALEEALWESFPVGDFLVAKVEERAAMLSKFHDTPLVVEPNLKEGAGGLRSFQAANWIGVAIGERAIKPTPEYDAVLRARNLLHFVSKRANDHLSRQRQAEISDLLCLEIHEWMRPLTQALVVLHRRYDEGLERLLEARYRLGKDVHAIRGEARVMAGADPGEASVGIAIATRLGLRVPELSVSVSDSVVGPAALHSLATGESTLRNLDRCGLLDRLLPELSACRFLLPDDSIHVFTVFEHSLRVVRFLDGLNGNDFLSDLKASLNNAPLLYLAALLHDAGKIDSSKPHSEVGSEIASNICQRWGLSARDKDQVAWLVREHLSMARFIRIRDMQNPATIAEFASIVGDVERLNALTLLTWADVHAVAPGTWTSAQESFLRELHAKTLDKLRGDSGHAIDAGTYRKRLIRQLSQSSIADEDVAAFVGSLPAHYLTNATPEVAKLHLAYFRKALEGGPTVEFNPVPELSATEITVCVPDAPGLLSRMLGVLYALDLSIEGIRASTTRTEKPVALDVFTVSLSGKPVPAATCRQISSAMMAVLKAEQTVESLLIEKGKDPFMQQRVFSHTYIEGDPGVLEVRATRGRGMPYRLSRFIAGQGWNIVAARVGQWAGSSAAAFYIQGKDEQPLISQQVESALRESPQSN
jgi:[protein-PII] uridylyltransferase